MRVVVDTNVLVSAMLTPGGTAWQVFSYVLTNRISLLADERILSEYEEVLKRKKFQFNTQDVVQLCNYLSDNAELIFCQPTHIKLDDADDTPFVEVAISGYADALITGNTRHYPVSNLRKIGIRVLTPSQFLQQEIETGD